MYILCADAFSSRLFPSLLSVVIPAPFFRNFLTGLHMERLPLANSIDLSGRAIIALLMITYMVIKSVKKNLQPIMRVCVHHCLVPLGRDEGSTVKLFPSLSIDPSLPLLALRILLFAVLVACDTLEGTFAQANFSSLFALELCPSRCILLVQQPLFCSYDEATSR